MKNKSLLRDMSLSRTVDDLRKETVELSQYINDVLSRVDAVEAEVHSLVPEKTEMKGSKRLFRASVTSNKELNHHYMEYQSE